jgi:CheY-like chemotaxis protein
VFRIYLPRTLAERTEHPDSPRIDSFPGMGEHILVVEDEASLRTLIARELTELGYRTSTAVDGQNALRMVQQQELYPDLLLTDVIMPGINGTELATRLRREHPDLKVLFMSGYSDELIQSHGVLEPGILFLGKPFRSNDLARKVREALQGRIEPQGSKNLLMIDDEPLFRDLLQHQCIKRGYEFTGVDTAAAALEALASQKFDVLLLDRNLPGSDGRRILQDIRQAGHDLPAILLTGDLASVDLPTFQALGVIHAVEKSADNAGLLDWLKDRRF